VEYRAPYGANNRKNRLETYSTIFLHSTGIEYARIEWVPPLKGAQPRISGFCFFAMIDWIPSRGAQPRIWQHLCVFFFFFFFFFWQNVAIYALFRKISPFMQFFGKMSRFTHFFLGSAQTVKITLSSAFKFLSALPIAGRLVHKCTLSCRCRKCGIFGFQKNGRQMPGKGRWRMICNIREMKYIAILGGEA